MFLRILFSLAFVFSHQFSVAVTATESEDDNIDGFVELDWNSAGTYKLSKSHSTISVPEDHFVVIGEEAVKERFLIDGYMEKNVEAVVYNREFSECVIFENYDEGYVKLDDWNEIDSQELLASTSEGTEIANQERIKLGISPIHVVGWIKEPILDRTTNTVYWALEAKDDSDGSLFVNSVALRLGLKGYEKLIWVSNKESYVPFGGKLDVMLRAHSYESGFRYCDYKPGDKVATYGVATLVAATVGGKIIKAGGFLVAFKKLGGFVFALIAAALCKVKNIFRRGNKTDHIAGGGE